MTAGAAEVTRQVIISVIHLGDPLFHLIHAAASKTVIRRTLFHLIHAAASKTVIRRADRALIPAPGLPG